MPWKMRKSKGGKYSVRSIHGLKAKRTTKNKALKQIRLLRWLEYRKQYNLPKPALYND